MYFEDCPLLESIVACVGGRRMKHIRTSGLRKGDEGIPIGVPYTIEIKSSIPVIYTK
ncbi:sensory rhodopsin transducer [Geobacillus vulcani]